MALMDLPVDSILLLISAAVVSSYIGLHYRRSPRITYNSTLSSFKKAIVRHNVVVGALRIIWRRRLQQVLTTQKNSASPDGPAKTFCLFFMII